MRFCIECSIQNAQLCIKHDGYSRNPSDPTASMYSILDQLEGMQTDDEQYELKLKYPGIGDIHWKQSANPVYGDSLLTGDLAYVEESTPIWHLVFQQSGCVTNYDVGEEAFNALFSRSTWPLVRYDRMDDSDNELAPYGFYRRLSAIPRGFSLYETLLNSFSSDGGTTTGNEQGVGKCAC